MSKEFCKEVFEKLCYQKILKNKGDLTEFGVRRGFSTGYLLTKVRKK